MHIIKGTATGHDWLKQFDINTEKPYTMYICRNCGMVAKKYGEMYLFIDEKEEIENVYKCRNKPKTMRRTK